MGRATVATAEYNPSGYFDVISLTCMPTLLTNVRHCFYVLANKQQRHLILDLLFEHLDSVSILRKLNRVANFHNFSHYREMRTFIGLSVTLLAIFVSKHAKFL